MKHADTALLGIVNDSAQRQLYFPAKVIVADHDREV
jgi:hypothetical protein